MEGPNLSRMFFEALVSASISGILPYITDHIRIFNFVNQALREELMPNAAVLALVCGLASYIVSRGSTKADGIGRIHRVLATGAAVIACSAFLLVLGITQGDFLADFPRAEVFLVQIGYIAFFMAFGVIVGTSLVIFA